MDISTEEYERITAEQHEKMQSAIRNHILQWVPALPKYHLCQSFQAEGGVYFIKNHINGLTKIGYAKNFEKRFHELKVSARHLGMQFEIEIIHTIPIVKQLMQALEYELHSEYNHCREIGEWFLLSETDMENIQHQSFEYVEYVINSNKEKLKNYFFQECSFKGELLSGVFNFKSSIDTLINNVDNALSVTKKLSEWESRYLAANEENFKLKNNIEALVA